MTTESVRAVSRAFGERGSDAWFKEPAAELLADYSPANDPDAPDGLDVAALTKMYDIFDVWFESGSSWHAAMRQRELGFPVDLYLEGSDQHRGWFQLSLLPGLGMTGHTPFTSVLTHGFMVAKDGRKMSKSGGNALDVDDLLKDYGADVCRWWVSSLAFENDIKVDIEFFTLAGESYRKVRNTLRFLLSNLGDFDPAKDAVALADLDPTSLDAYVLSLAGELQEQVLKAFTEYEFRKAHQLLYDFCNETLSAFYCAAVKDRLYCDRVDAPRRRSAQTVLHTVAHMLVRLLAPIVPHSADEAFSALSGDQNLCVQLETIADPPAVTVDADFATVMKIRDDVLRALEQAKEQGINNSLDAEVLLPDPKGVLAKFKSDLPDMLGVSRVICDAAAEAVSVKDLRDQPCCERSWKRDGTVKQRSDGGMLSDRDAEAVGVGD